VITHTARHIKELRYRLGMTQEQFAVELGVTVASVRRWENNKVTPSPLAMKVMESLESLNKQ
jgi:putative transcriptional regulator